MDEKTQNDDKMMKVTFEDVQNDPQIQALIRGASHVLNVMNYTEHGLRHVGYVARTAHMILTKLGYDAKTAELARIAGYIHDVGNMINRKNHGITAATLVYPMLRDMGMPLDDVCEICSAVGNHEEEIGWVVNPIAAALIIADKSDAHRTRVKRLNQHFDDIHDIVNYSIRKNIVLVDSERKIISVKFYMDNSSSVMDYLRIFLPRMIMCEKAAKFLGCSFRLYINDIIINTVRQMTPTQLDSVKDED